MEIKICTVAVSVCSSRCSFPCVFSLVYIVIVFVRCFICSFNRTVYRSRLKLLELVNINRQWQLQRD